MSSKKSVKMDWATLAVNSNPDLVLPTAPDPNRTYEGRRGGYGGNRDNRDRNDDRYNTRSEWSRSGDRGDRNYQGDRGGDRNYQGRNRESDQDSRWGRGDNRSFGSRNNDANFPDNLNERPKLNLAPRSIPTNPSASNANSAPSNNVSRETNIDQSTEKKDKWDNVFQDKFQGSGNNNPPKPLRNDFSTSGDARLQSRNSGDFRRKDQYDEEAVKDPRFVNKFSSLKNLDTPPRESSEPPKEKSQIITLSEDLRKAVIEPEVNKKPVDSRKAAKAAARAEDERKAKEEKDQALAAKQAALLAANEAHLASIKICQEIYDKNLKGETLSEYISSLSSKPEPSSLISVILNNVNDPCNNTASVLKWCSKSEYGSALGLLLKGQPKKQLSALFEIQKYFNNIKFPKVEVKSEKRNLIELLFQVLFSNDIIEQAGFQEWMYDETEEIPGKQTAVIQTTNFMIMLNDIDQDEEEYEDDEVDAVRETI